MDSAANDKFANELKQALGSFLGLPVNATTSLLTDLLYSLEAQTRIMEQFNGRDKLFRHTINLQILAGLQQDQTSHYHPDQKSR